MHERRDLARDETVVDEEVLVHVERRVETLEITRPVSLDAVAQGQVLGSGRGPNRIRLHEAERIDRGLERGGREQGSCHGKPAQVVQGHGGRGRFHRHSPIVLHHPIGHFGWRMAEGRRILPPLSTFSYLWRVRWAVFWVRVFSGSP